MRRRGGERCDHGDDCGEEDVAGGLHRLRDFCDG
jgi:hypothetical protein